MIKELRHIADISALLQGEREVFVVCDRNVEWVAWEAGTFVGAVSIDTSESLKTMGTVMEICKWLLENNATRDALLLAVGGGITTDLAGFAAAIYKRGIRYANVPTTLLAQVDAAIGGKTGVNFLEYKNMLGAFRMPEFTAICPDVLKTLPARQIKAGLAEMLKTFIIADASAYAQAVSSLKKAVFADGDTQTVASSLKKAVFADGDLILKAAAIKESIVTMDPYERGPRTKLNLGHTFAHAIEHKALEAGDDILHGEAVAMGIIMAAEMAEREGIAEKGLAARLKADFQSLGLPTECPYTGLEEAMAKDKKAAGGKIHFVLPERIGSVVVK
ncbi:MAG: 3-dehydroquinate synthase [Bacteroidales bacterium]|nr:3-dehydroquinate synthase [Bacteroidales bacterium]